MAASSPHALDPRGAWPAVSIVFLVYNRCEELRISLREMLRASDYPPESVEVIVVDNASTDGCAAMVREEFPQVRLIVRERNIGVSGWNDGLQAARGDWVLALDDDCYLPPDGLRRAVEAAVAHDADLVSFRVVSTEDPSYVFSDLYRTGLFMFWGCAVLMRREVVAALGGYDPEIFVWANELEFMIRFFDHGFRHLHFPEVTAYHMKPLPTGPQKIEVRGYRINARHWGYIAAKLLRRRDAFEALVALVARALRDGIREQDATVAAAALDVAKGFVHGLRHRQPVRNGEVSRSYRRNFESFASPWWLSRTPRELLRALPRELVREGIAQPIHAPSKAGARRERYFEERARFYPAEPATLQF